ncbi:MAG: class I SAM-dependent methyltransferase, partial [Planctomycetota bacterium]
HPFFEHTRYLAIDRRMYSEKLKEGTDVLDIEGDALSVPLKEGVADMMLSISMLEHMSEPLAYLREAHRVLKPGGRLCLFVPFNTGVHMAPYDYFRYTRYGLEHLFHKAGFTELDIRPSCGAFATVLGNTKKLIPHFADKGWLVKKIGSLLIWRILIPLSNRVDHWDTKRDFPRFYLAFARKSQ